MRGVGRKVEGQAERGQSWKEAGGLFITSLDLRGLDLVMLGASGTRGWNKTCLWDTTPHPEPGGRGWLGHVVEGELEVGWFSQVFESETGPPAWVLKPKRESI